MNQNLDTCETSASSDDQSAGSPDAGEDGEQCCVTCSIDTEDDDLPDSTWLTDKLEQAVAALGLKQVEFSMVLVNDDRMTRLHDQFMDDPTTTDVLTFDLHDASNLPGAGVEGEVYICVDEARRRAVELKHDLRDEVLLYAVHGLLHLVGYNDHDADDHARMHAKEDELLTAIGVGSVYGNSGRGSSSAAPGDTKQ